MDSSIASRHYHVSLLVLLAVALGLLWASTRAGGADSEPSQAWMATKDKFHASLRVLWGETALHLHHEARLRQDTAQLSRNLQVAWHQIEGLVTSMDSLHRQPLTPEVRRYAEACGESINNCTERAGLLAQALETEHARANLAITRVARADSIIAAGLKATDCRWLLFKCPSRTAIGVVTFTLGALAALAATH